MIRHAALALTLLSAAPAHADWLDDAWTNDSVDRNGGPAVTLNGGGVTLVLPADTLAAARAEGVGTDEAVALFIERYGQHCSDIIDLDHRQKLSVQLFLSQPVDLDDASETTQQEVGNALKSVTASGKRPPHVKNLFVTEPGARHLTIDYVPSRKASCVKPGGEGDKLS